MERDYWLAERRLRAIESAGITIILRGGISLSKVFGLIQPFSEDMDVLGCLYIAVTQMYTKYRCIPITIKREGSGGSWPLCVPSCPRLCH